MIPALVEAFRTRALSGEHPYVWVDATYHKVRVDGRVTSQATVVAVGVTAERERRVLGIDVGWPQGRSARHAECCTPVSNTRPCSPSPRACIRTAPTVPSWSATRLSSSRNAGSASHYPAVIDRPRSSSCERRVHNTDVPIWIERTKKLLS